MKYKKIIAGISAILMCSACIPFASASAEDAVSVDESNTTYTKYMAGDVTLDGKVNVADLVAGTKLVVGTSLGDSANYVNADIDGSRNDDYKYTVDATDIKAIADYIVGNKTSISITVQPQAVLSLAAGKNTIALDVSSLITDGILAEGYESKIGYGYGKWDSDQRGEATATVTNGILTFELELDAAYDNVQIQLYVDGITADSIWEDGNNCKVKIGVAGSGSSESSSESTESTEASTESSSETDSTEATESTEATTESTEPTEDTTESVATPGDASNAVALTIDGNNIDVTNVTGAGTITVTMSGIANAKANAWFGFTNSEGTWDETASVNDVEYDENGVATITITLTGKPNSNIQYACYYSSTNNSSTSSFVMKSATFTPAE